MELGRGTILWFNSLRSSTSLGAFFILFATQDKILTNLG